MKKNSFSHGALYLTLSTFIFVLSGYIINIWLGKFLGPAQYGIYGLLISLITLVNLTQTSGLPLAVAKFIAEDEKNADTVLKSGIIIQIFSTVFVSIMFFLFAFSISTVFSDTSLVAYLQLSSLIFPVYGIYSVYLNFYNGQHLFKTQAFLGITYSLFKLISVIGFVYLFHVYGVMFGFMLSPLLALLFFFHLPKNINAFPYKKLILFSIPLIAVAIFSNLLQSVDLFFVKAFLHNNKYVGIYTANQNIAEIPFYAVAALSSVLFPSISRTVSQKLNNETKNLISKSLRFSLFILMPSVLIISATSGQALRFLYTPLYLSGAQSLSFLVVGNLFFALFVILSTVITASGKPFVTAIFAGTGMALNCLLCAIFIPMLGIFGAAISTTLSCFIIMIISGVLVYKKFEVLVEVKSALKICAASIIVFFLAKIVIFPTIFLPIFYIFFFSVYTMLLVIMKEFTKEDFDFIQKLFSHKQKL